MIILTVVAGREKGRVHRLGGDKAHTIGRNHGSVPIDDRSVSRHHARIEPTHTGWTITDLESGNGTFLNQQRLTSSLAVPLEDGDRIQVGRVMLVFNDADTSDPSNSSSVISVAMSGETHHGAELLQQALQVQQQNQHTLDLVAHRLEELSQQVQRLGGAGEGDRSEASGPPAAGDLADLSKQIAELRDTLKTLTNAEPSETPAKVDLTELRDALQPLPRREDLSEAMRPVLDAVAALASTNGGAEFPTHIEELREAIDHLPERMSAREEIEQLRRAVAAIQVPEPADLREPLEALRQTLSSMEVAALPAMQRELKALRDEVGRLPAEGAADMKPQLQAIEQALAALPRESALGAAMAEIRDMIASLPQPVDSGPAVAEVLEAVRAVQSSLPEVPDVRPELARVQASIEHLANRDVPDHRDDLAAMREALKEISQQVTKREETAALASQLAELRGAFERLPVPVDATPAVEQVLEAVRAIEIPAVPELPDVSPELAKVRTAIESLADRDVPDHRAELAALRESVAEIARRELPDPREEIAGLRAAVDRLGQKEPEGIDLTPVLASIEQVQQAVANQPSPVDVRSDLDKLGESLRTAVEAAKPSDVRSELAELREELQRLGNGLAAMPQPDVLVQPVREMLAAEIDPRLEQLTGAIAANSGESLHRELSQLRETVDALAHRYDEPRKGVEEVRDHVQGAANAAVAPLQEQVAALRAAVEELNRERDAQRTSGDGGEQLDLSGVQQQLAELTEQLQILGTRATAGPDEDVQAKLDALLVTATEPNDPSLDAKLDVIYDAITELKNAGDEGDVAALLAAASSRAEEGDGVDSAVLGAVREIAQRLGRMEQQGGTTSADVDIEALRAQISSEFAEQNRATAAAIQELRQTVAPLAERPTAIETARAVAQENREAAGITADEWRSLVDEVRALGQRGGQEKVLADLFAAMREMQLQQEQQADRLLRLVADAEPEDRSQMAAEVIAEASPLVPDEPLMPRPVVEFGGPASRVGSSLVTVAVVIVIVLAGFMAVAGTARLL